MEKLYCSFHKRENVIFKILIRKSGLFSSKWHMPDWKLSNSYENKASSFSSNICHYVLFWLRSLTKSVRNFLNASNIARKWFIAGNLLDKVEDSMECWNISQFLSTQQRIYIEFVQIRRWLLEVSLGGARSNCFRTSKQKELAVEWKLRRISKPRTGALFYDHCGFLVKTTSSLFNILQWTGVFSSPEERCFWWETHDNS